MISQQNARIQRTGPIASNPCTFLDIIECMHKSHVKKLSGGNAVCHEKHPFKSVAIELKETVIA